MSLISDSSRSSIDRYWRYVPAVLLLVLPVLNLPLAFLRLTGEKVPLFGTVTAAGCAETGTVALAVVILFHRQAFFELARQRLLQIWCGAGTLLFIAALYKQMVYRDVWSNVETALMYTLLPLAAAVLKKELLRLIPGFSFFILLLSAASGLLSEQFTGFTGNWNWTQAMLIAAIPGAVVFCRLRKELYWSIGIAAAVMILFALLAPELISRAVLLATAAGTVLLLTGRFIPEQFKNKTALFATAAVTVALAAFIVICDQPDSRVQLWKGSFALFAEYPLSGIGGIYRFPEFIAPFLPEKYFFSPFAASLHTHPHNEFLSMACSYGIWGIIYLGIILWMLLGSAMQKPDREKLPALWWGIIIFICGQFDLTASIPPGAVMLLICTEISTGDESAFPAETVPIWQCRFAACMLMLYVAGNMVSMCRATWQLRAGQLAMLKGDLPKAIQHYEKSIAIRPTRHALYELAEIELGKRNSPQRTFGLLYRLEEELGSSNYLHTNRLKAVSLVQLRQAQKAENFLKTEITHYPYSIINARLHWLLLQILRRPQQEIAAAQQHFLNLCALRKISPVDAVKITPPQDDSALEAPPQEGR